MAFYAGKILPVLKFQPMLIFESAIATVFSLSICVFLSVKIKEKEIPIFYCPFIIFRSSFRALFLVGIFLSLISNSLIYFLSRDRSIIHIAESTFPANTLANMKIISHTESSNSYGHNGIIQDWAYSIRTFLWSPDTLRIVYFDVKYNRTQSIWEIRNQETIFDSTIKK